MDHQTMKFDKAFNVNFDNILDWDEEEKQRIKSIFTDLSKKMLIIIKQRIREIKRSGKTRADEIIEEFYKLYLLSDKSVDIDIVSFELNEKFMSDLDDGYLSGASYIDEDGHVNIKINLQNIDRNIRIDSTVQLYDPDCELPYIFSCLQEYVNCNK